MYCLLFHESRSFHFVLGQVVVVLPLSRKWCSRLYCRCRLGIVVAMSWTHYFSCVRVAAWDFVVKISVLEVVEEVSWVVMKAVLMCLDLVSDLAMLHLGLKQELLSGRLVGLQVLVAAVA